jgi:carboxypeptidase Q
MNLRQCSLLAGLLAACSLSPRFAGAQLSPAVPDPLAQMRERAAANAQACSESELSACAQATPKIIADALGPSPLAANLRRLTDGIGGRLTGTPAMARAVEWAVAAFRDAGVDEVHTEKYVVPVTWSEGATRLRFLSPAPFPVRLVSLAGSPATPPGGIVADVVDVGAGDAEDFSRAAGKTRGTILLVHTGLLRSRDDLLGEYTNDPAVVARSLAAGARAILWMSPHRHLLLYRQPTRMDGLLEKLPQAVLAREDAERLARDLAAGQTVRVRLEMLNHVGGPVEQQNVVAEIRGREKPDEFVLLGAHLDSWDLGTGALDAGCNAALVIEAARDIHRTGLRPRRSIRFVLFSGEEQGMLGSRAYVRAHRAELGRAIAAVIFEGGSGRVTGFSSGGRRDLEAGVLESLAPLESWGVTHDTHDAYLGADDFDFLIEGVPTLVANQQDGGYWRNYHAESDTYDKVDLVNLKLNTAVAGVLAFSLAEHPTPLGPRLSRDQIEALLQQTGLDAEMKAVGLWKQWESGQRGRSP